MANVGDVLYGIKKGVMEELDPSTQLPKADGVKIQFTTADSAEMEPAISEGEEQIQRTDERILAVVSTPDLLYGYNIKLTDNTFNAQMASLVEGGVVKTGESSTITGYSTPKLQDGCTTKLFRLTLYVANYEGDSIKNYAKIIFHKCRGTASTMSIGKEFYAPEFNVKAREATKAGLPCRDIEYVDVLPTDAQ